VRVPARTKRDARKRYVRFLQLSLACVSQTAHFITGPRPIGGTDELALTTEPEKIRLPRANQEPIYLTATQNFRFEPDPDFAKEWKIKTDGYAYHVFVTEDEAGQLFAWHWHPEIKLGCHVHVGARQGKSRALYRLHVPSGRVAFEEVLRFLIVELDVETARKDWDGILSDSQARFEAFRTWPGVRLGGKR
jgi:hypothetical protein